MLKMRHTVSGGESDVVDEANFEEAGWAELGWELVVDEPEPVPEVIEVTAADVAAFTELVPADDDAEVLDASADDDPATPDLDPDSPPSDPEV